MFTPRTGGLVARTHVVNILRVGSYTRTRFNRNTLRRQQVLSYPQRKNTLANARPQRNKRINQSRRNDRRRSQRQQTQQNIKSHTKQNKSYSKCLKIDKLKKIILS